MAESHWYFTYRVTNIPQRVTEADLRRLFDDPDRENIIKISLAACPYRFAAFSVATVTFKGPPTFRDQITSSGSKSVEYKDGLITIDDNFIGLTPLNRVHGTVAADLIAITGLAGRGFESWQNKLGQMWLRDYLPLALPACRISVYGYPSKARSGQSEANIQDFTRDFVKQTFAFRAQHSDAQTPLILIGHSLGCVIIKQAIVESTASFAADIPPLHRSVCGIVFFGAPHRGLNNPELQELVQGTPPENLVRDLKPNSSLLTSLNQFFPNACKDIKIISCYETERTKTRQLEEPSNLKSKWVKTGPARFMVPPTSACLYWEAGREVSIAIHADHSEMAKLTDMHGSAYYNLERELVALVEVAPALMDSRKDIEIAGNKMLNLFFIFHYECSFLRAWESCRTGATLHHGYLEDFHVEDTRLTLVPKVPYGHPAYSRVTELSLLLELLHVLLEKYRQNTADENRDFADSVPKLFALSSAPSIPLESDPQSERQTQTTKNRNKLVYKLDNWSASDRYHFVYLLQKFRAINEELSNLGPHTKSLDILASTGAINALPQNAAPLEHTQNMSRTNQLYNALRERASLRKEYLQTNSKHTKPDFKFPIAWIEEDPRAGSTKYKVLNIRANTSPRAGSGPRWMFVEHRSYDLAQDFSSQQKAEEQASDLARELGIATKPPLLRTLKCAGFVQQVTSKQFMFLFELPNWVDITRPATTLHSLLVDKTLSSTLAERLRLARDLTLSVAELHGAGILHKGLHSGNIIFFHPRFQDSIDINRWFLGGFEASRLDQDNQLSIDPAGGVFDIYKHPDLRDQSNKLQGRPGSARRHDVYSLGLILLEVGLWQRLDATGMQKQGDTPAMCAKRFFDIASKYLPRWAGRRYCDAVLACLDRSSPGLSKEEQSKSTLMQRSENAAYDHERGGISLQLLVERVVQRLESCQCRE